MTLTVDDLRHRGDFSERILRRVPVSLLEYPLEVLLSAWGAVSAPPILLGFAGAPSIARLLPAPIAYAWALFLFLSSLTIAAGLWRRHYGTTVARGLQLLAVTCVVYALAIITSIGWRNGIPVGPLLTVIAFICGFRAWWLVTRRKLIIRIDEESRR